MNKTYEHHLMLLDILKAKKSMYDDGHSYYIVFPTKLMKDSILGSEGKIVEFHFPDKGFNIAVDTCRCKDYEHLQRGTVYNQEIKIVRPNKKCMEIVSMRTTDKGNRMELGRRNMLK